MTTSKKKAVEQDAMILPLICKKEGSFSRCKPMRAKKKPIKFYCSVCKRFVLPDKYHLEEAVPSFILPPPSWRNY